MCAAWCAILWRHLYAFNFLREVSLILSRRFVYCKFNDLFLFCSFTLEFAIAWHQKRRKAFYAGIAYTYHVTHILLAKLMFIVGCLLYVVFYFLSFLLFLFVCILLLLFFNVNNVHVYFVWCRCRFRCIRVCLPLIFD